MKKQFVFLNCFFIHRERLRRRRQAFIIPNGRSDEYLVPLTCLFPTAPVNGYQGDTVTTMSPAAGQSTAYAPPAVALPHNLIQDGEQIVLAIKPSLFFIVLTCLPFFLAAALVAVGAKVLDEWLPAVPLRLVATVAVLSCLGRLIVAGLQWLARFYVLTDRRVLRIRGVLSVQIFECPLTRIQNTSLVMTLAERVVGLGTLYFATAGTAGYEAAWLMIAKPREVHEVVVEYVNRAQRGGNSGTQVGGL